jgi:regulator of replication initiation timing
METVFCECKKCDAPIGRFVNLWTQIGKSYFSPVVEPEDDLAVGGQGAVRIGERGTLVEEWSAPCSRYRKNHVSNTHPSQLQDIVCSNCAALLGLRCIQTPVNHVLDEYVAWQNYCLPLLTRCPRNQLMLRLASVELLDNDGLEIEFVIKRVLRVNEPSKVNHSDAPDPSKGPGFTSAFPGAAQLRQLQIDLHGQREDIQRIDSNGFRIVSALDKRADRINGEVTKLKGTVGVVHRDVGDLQKELGSIKADIGKVRASAQDANALVQLGGRLTAVSNTLGEVGQQVAALSDKFQKEVDELRSELGQQQQDMEDLRSNVRDGVAADDYTRDMVDLRSEMAHLRRQLDETRAHGLGRVETAFPPRELEVLTSNIAKIGNRASQVESLQMELEMLKGRVERAEASRQTVDNRRSISTIDAGGPPGYSDIFPGTRKRAASPGTDPIPKRPASSAGYANFLNRRYATPPLWPANPPTTANQGEATEDGTSRMANSAKKGPRGRATATPTGTSMRLRKR